MDVDASDVPELVTACCVLHNLCEINGELFDSDWIEGVEGDYSNSVSTSRTNSTQVDSVEIRNAIIQYLAQ